MLRKPTYGDSVNVMDSTHHVLVSEEIVERHGLKTNPFSEFHRTIWPPVTKAPMLIVIVISRFLERHQKQMSENQLNHRRYVKSKSVCRVKIREVRQEEKQITRAG